VPQLDTQRLLIEFKFIETLTGHDTGVGHNLQSETALVSLFTHQLGDGKRLVSSYFDIACGI
jgi:hypothetical protein